MNEGGIFMVEVWGDVQKQQVREMEVTEKLIGEEKLGSGSRGAGEPGVANPWWPSCGPNGCHPVGAGGCECPGGQDLPVVRVQVWTYVLVAFSP